MKKLLLAIGMAVMIFAAVVPSASAHDVHFFTDGGYWGGGGNPILSCAGGPQTLGPDGTIINNPKKCTLCEAVHTGVHVGYFVLTILLFVIVPILIMWGGALIVISGGDTEKVGQGKKVISGAAIGIALGLGAYIIVNTFLTYLPQSVVSKTEWGNFNCDKIPTGIVPAGLAK